MKGNSEIVEALNETLTAELTAINQYFIHYRMRTNWGFERIGKKSFEESVGEMKHADQVIQRILFLDGIPNMQRLSKVKVGETVSEQLQLDLELELMDLELELTYLDFTLLYFDDFVVHVSASFPHVSRDGHVADSPKPEIRLRSLMFVDRVA